MVASSADMAEISKTEPGAEPDPEITNDTPADDAPLDEQMRQGTPSSVESTPEPASAEGLTQDNPPPQKRKGGRKPVSRCRLSLLRHPFHVSHTLSLLFCTVTLVAVIMKLSS